MYKNLFLRKHDGMLLWGEKCTECGDCPKLEGDNGEVTTVGDWRLVDIYMEKYYVKERVLQEYYEQVVVEQVDCLKCRHKISICTTAKPMIELRGCEQCGEYYGIELSPDHQGKIIKRVIGLKREVLDEIEKMRMASKTDILKALIIKDDVEKAIKEIKDAGFNPYGVLWGQLPRCKDVQIGRDTDGRGEIGVFLAGVSPKAINLQKHVLDYLTRRGHKNVVLTLQWD